MRQNLKAIIFLMILSPSIAELLSSSSPPIEFFNPISFLYLTTFYGFGALLVRELRIRKNMNYTSLIFLGFAYGVLEEGVAVKSFFNPAWPDLGILAWYGRMYGVNWIWLIALTAYHGIVSIFIPIAISDIIFNDLKDQPYVQNGKKIVIITFIFIFDILLFNIGFMGSYPLNLLHYLLCLVLIGIFYILADRSNITPFFKPNKVFVAWFIGFIWMALFYIIYFGLPNSIDFPLLIAVIGIVHTYLAINYYSMLKIDKIKEKIKFASLIGPPSFFTLISPFIEMDKTRSDNPTGMTLVGILFALIFILLYRKISSRDESR